MPKKKTDDSKTDEKVYQVLVDENGWLKIPRALIKKLGWKAGTWLQIDELPGGVISLTKLVTKKVLLKLDLPTDLVQHLKALAKQRKVSVSFIVEELIVEMLDRLEEGGKL